MGAEREERAHRFFPEWQRKQGAAEVLRALNTVFDFLYDYFLIPSIKLLGFATTFVVLLQIFSRHFMDQPFAWTEEASRFLFIWFCFLGSAVALVNDQHLGINYFVNKFPAGLRRVGDIFVDLLIGSFGVFVFWNSLRLMEFAGSQVSTIIRMPMKYVYLAFPVMAGFFVLISLIRIFRRALGEGESPQQPTF